MELKSLIDKMKNLKVKKPCPVCNSVKVVCEQVTGSGIRRVKAHVKCLSCGLTTKQVVVPKNSKKTNKLQRAMFKAICLWSNRASDEPEIFKTKHSLVVKSDIRNEWSWKIITNKTIPKGKVVLNRLGKFPSKGIAVQDFNMVADAIELEAF